MKKKTRLLIAGLMLIAVTGASTLAYFTGSNTISATNTGQMSLSITNGKVVISAQAGTNAATPYWSYDVARKSTVGYPAVDEEFTAYTKVYTNIDQYEKINRSPDLLGIGVTVGGTNTAATEAALPGVLGTEKFAETKEVVGGSYARWSIGAPVKAAIKNARPGDAFVMGTAVAGGGANAEKGLVIKNDSNLTVKVKLNVVADVPGQGYTLFSSLGAAGWKLYVEGSEIIAADEAGFKTALATAIAAKSTIANGSSSTLDIRLELPLATTDTYQGDGLPVGAGTITSFDLNKLFTIVATQENNPGWNQDGTN